MKFETKIAVELSASEKENLVETQNIVNELCKEFCKGFGDRCDCCPLHNLCEHLQNSGISEDLMELFNKIINTLTK